MDKLHNRLGFDPIQTNLFTIVHTITQRPFAPREKYGIMKWGDLL